MRLLASELVTEGGRMDAIGIDENRSPVISEYKGSTNENVINQGLFYLSGCVVLGAGPPTHRPQHP